jgi:hypothetical protein
VKDVIVEVGREAAAGTRSGAVQRARASLLGATLLRGLKAEQSQDGSHGDGGAHGVEVDGGLSCARGWRLLMIVLGLTSLFAALAGLSQLAVAFVEDCLVTAGELVFRRDVADGRV